MAGNLNCTLASGLPASVCNMLPAGNSVPDVSSADFAYGAPIKTVYTSEKHFRDLVENLNNLRQNRDLCDVNIIVNDRQILCHRVVLAACR